MVSHVDGILTASGVTAVSGTFTNLTVSGLPVSIGGGSGTPGGSDTHVQFNDGGVFGGDTGLTYNKTTDTLTTVTMTGTTGQFGGQLSSGSFITDGTANFRGGLGGGTSVVVNGTTRDHRVFVHAEDDFSVGMESHGGGQPAGIRLYKTDGTEDSPAAVSSGTVLGVLAAYGHDGTDFGQSARIRAVAKKTASAGNTPGRLEFSTASEGSQTNINRGYVDDDGWRFFKHDAYDIQDIRSETIALTHGATVSGVPVLHQGITGVTISGSTLTKGQLNFVGSRAGNVGIVGSTITFDAPPAGAGGGGSGITAVVQDTAPQLGGRLDTNGFTISGTSVKIQPINIGTVELFSGDSSFNNPVPQQGEIWIRSKDSLGNVAEIDIANGDISIAADAVDATVSSTADGTGGTNRMSADGTDGTASVTADGLNGAAVMSADGVSGTVSVSASDVTGAVDITGGASVSINSDATVSLLAPVVTGTEFRTGGTVRAQTGAFQQSLTAQGFPVQVKETFTIIGGDQGAADPVWSNQAVARNFFFGSAVRTSIRKVDAGGKSQVRLNLIVTTSGAANSVIGVRAFPAFSTTVGNYQDCTVTGALQLATNSKYSFREQSTGWMSLKPEYAVDGTFFCVAGSGGDGGASDPAYAHVSWDIR